jgi:hypothetical protein
VDTTASSIAKRVDELSLTPWRISLSEYVTNHGNCSFYQKTSFWTAAGIVFQSLNTKQVPMYESVRESLSFSSICISFVHLEYTSTLSSSNSRVSLPRWCGTMLCIER